jgi:hypothetical protein
MAPVNFAVGGEQRLTNWRRGGRLFSVLKLKTKKPERKIRPSLYFLVLRLSNFVPFPGPRPGTRGAALG